MVHHVEKIGLFVCVGLALLGTEYAGGLGAVLELVLALHWGIWGVLAGFVFIVILNNIFDFYFITNLICYVCVALFFE